MEETKQLTKVNDSMLKRALLKVGAVFSGVVFIATMAGCPNDPGPGPGPGPTYKSSPWGSLEIGTRCGSHDMFNCFGGVASSMGHVDLCHPTDECMEKTENVYFNALHYIWNMRTQGHSVAHDLTKTNTSSPTMQRYMGQGYQAFPCTVTTDHTFAYTEANAWDCNSWDWGGGYLGY